jgi:hypothetical protein
MYDSLAGTLRETSEGYSFTYDSEYLDRADAKAVSSYAIREDRRLLRFYGFVNNI